MRDGYLIDIDKREDEAVEWLVQNPVYAEFFFSLGLNQSFSWYLLRRTAPTLVASIETDIDLLAGRLEWADPQRFLAVRAEVVQERPGWHPSRHDELAAWKVAGEGGIRWPPSLSYLVAVEAKCAYLPANSTGISLGALKATKKSKGKVRRVRRQVDSLLSMGFDRVALLDVIANPPGDGVDFQAWLAGSSIAIDTLKAMELVLSQRLRADQHAAGHYAWSLASVAGGDERDRGGGIPFCRRPASENPLLANETGRTHRREMEQNLERLLAVLPRPFGFPVIFVHCEACGMIHPAGCRCARAGAK